MAIAKRSELQGAAFDLWAFDEAQYPASSSSGASPSSSWALSSDGQTYTRTLGERVEVALSVRCYEGLLRRHVGSKGNTVRDIDAVALRYVPLHKGLQAACPDAVFAVLKELWEVDTECFASPLNCRLAHFCSAFPDVDSAFGSLGSFFDYFPSKGSFEVNPPFIEEIIERAHKHMERLLAAATGPLMFVVIVPRWQSKPCWQRLSASKWITRTSRLKLEEHRFSHGAVGAANGEALMATNETSLLFLQNEAAKEKWPIEDLSIHKLKLAFGLAPKVLANKKKKKKSTTREEPTTFSPPAPTPQSIAREMSSGKSNWEKLQSSASKKKRIKPN